MDYPESTVSYHSWAFLPTLILEKVFAYLSWRDRAKAALTCKRWLNCFCSPNVWHRFTYHPPVHGLTGLQYDLKTYFLGKGIRAIGWHFRSIRFPETDDFFMLNRVLTLIADFLEAHPNTFSVSDSSFENCETAFYELAALEEACLKRVSGSSSSSSLSDFEEVAIPTPQSEENPTCETLGFGDPDLEASLRLALRLQEQDYLGLSNSSSSEGGNNFTDLPSSPTLSSSAPQRCSFRSVSTTCNEPPPISRSRHYQRSQSCRFPAASSVRARLPYPPDTSHLPPPYIRSFSLDFHSELDELSGAVYGSGGALFATICRVLRQLKGLRSLYLRNLFLSPSDARKLVLELSSVAGSSLERVSLLHVCKLHFDRPLSVAPHSNQMHEFDLLPSFLDRSPRRPMFDQFWYLLDERWLSARPLHLGWNPLADLPHLFPNLRRLELALTQLTGPMLLRLLFLTPLSELILTQTDLTPKLPDHDETTTHQIEESAIDDVSDSFSNITNPGDDFFVNWGADVPSLHSGSSSRPVPEWRPIESIFWRYAIQMRPKLRVLLRFKFLSAQSSSLNLALPSLPAPVSCATCVFGSEDRLSSKHRLIDRCMSSLSRYSATLIRLSFLAEIELQELEAEENAQYQRYGAFTRLHSNRQEKQPREVEPTPLDSQLLQLVRDCPHVYSLDFGGHLFSLHLITVGQLCRSIVSASHRLCQPVSEEIETRPSLNIDVSSIRLSGPLPESASPSETIVFKEVMQDCRGSEFSPAVKLRAAESFVAASLHCSRWRFMHPVEFRSHVNRT